MSCIWKVAEEDRRCEYCLWYEGCDERPTEKMEREKFYIETMSILVGKDILTDTHERNVVYGRNMVAYQLTQEGYGVCRIGRILGRHYTTVVYAKYQIIEMLRNPRLYKREMEIWEQFQKIIKSKYYVEEDSEMVVLPGSESGGTQG